MRSAPPRSLRGWLPTLGRLVLAAVWIGAGVAKITDLDGAVRAVRAYRLLPDIAAQVVGAGLPVVEIMLGLLLLVGAGVRVGAVVSAVLLLGFLVGIGSAWARGLRIDCGCFGSGGELKAGESPSYGWDLVRDGALFVLAIALARWPNGYLAIDGLLTGGRKEERA